MSQLWFNAEEISNRLEHVTDTIRVLCAAQEEGLLELGQHALFLPSYELSEISDEAKDLAERMLAESKENAARKQDVPRRVTVATAKEDQLSPFERVVIGELRNADFTAREAILKLLDIEIEEVVA